MSHRPSRVRWTYIAPAILLFWILANVDKNAIAFFVTNRSFLQAMHLTGRPALIGLLLALFIWPYGICNFLWGMAVDRVGPRRSAIASLLGWAVAMILGGASLGFAMLAASRIVLAVGEASLWPVSLKLTSTWFPRTERARAQTTYGYGAQVGFIVGAFLVTSLLTTIGWRAAFFVLAALAVVIVLPVFWLWVRDLPQQHPKVNAEERRELEGGNLREVSRAGEQGSIAVFRDVHYWLLVYTFVVSAVGSFGLGGWLPSFLRQAHHFSPGLLATWTSLAYVAAILTFFVSSYLADRTRQYAVIGVAGLVVAAACLIIAGTTTNAVLAAVLVAVGFGTVLTPVIITPSLLQQYYAGQRIQGRASGVMTGVSNLLSGFAPLIIGVFVGAQNGRYTGAFVFLTAVIVAGALCFVALLPDERRRARLAATRMASMGEPSA